MDSPPRSPAPSSFNFSRFLSNVVKLEERRGLISGMIDTMRGELMDLLPDFGENLGYDGKEQLNGTEKPQEGQNIRS